MISQYKAVGVHRDAYMYKTRRPPRSVRVASPSLLTRPWVLLALPALLLIMASLRTFSVCSLVAFSLPSTVFAKPKVTNNSPGLPMVINTWGGPFTIATDAAYKSLLNSQTSALDAVELGCATCEANQCDGSVGFGGSPDERCETTLDAMIMDGTTMKSGSVAAIRRIKDVISVARAVLEHTTHTMLAGDFATEFAISNGFVEQNLTTEDSAKSCEEWKASGCQPNYRINVTPDPGSSCGPYTPLTLDSSAPDYATNLVPRDAPEGHDTISMIALHSSGTMAAGTSTNGAGRKVPGRVGDGPITGSGSYVDGDVGGCGATGDVSVLYLPSESHHALTLESGRHHDEILTVLSSCGESKAGHVSQARC